MMKDPASRGMAEPSVQAIAETIAAWCKARGRHGLKSQETVVAETNKLGK
jgi:hypothetical protein